VGCEDRGGEVGLLLGEGLLPRGVRDGGGDNLIDGAADHDAASLGRAGIVMLSSSSTFPAYLAG